MCTKFQHPSVSNQPSSLLSHTKGFEFVGKRTEAEMNFHKTFSIFVGTWKPRNQRESLLWSNCFLWTANNSKYKVIFQDSFSVCAVPVLSYLLGRGVFFQPPNLPWQSDSSSAGCCCRLVLCACLGFRLEAPQRTPTQIARRRADADTQSPQVQKLPARGLGRSV